MTERETLILEDLHRLMQIHNIQFEPVECEKHDKYLMLILSGSDVLFSPTGKLTHKDLNRVLKKRGNKR